MKIGPYELISELGRGGMAQVWLAHKVWEDGKRRACVIKLPRRSAVADEGMLRQSLEEARLSILLQHNNIVSVFDAGVHEGLPYLVMNYVAGKDLAQLLKATSRLDATWDVETAVHVAREVAQGLHYAHELEQQIIHRDVASKNVMIDGSGGVLLTDFGVATSLSTLTSRIHVKGTLSYMAPEHYLGQTSPAADVFGLGAILWEMLAGRRFRGELSEGEELIAAVVKGSVDPVGRTLPRTVEHVLEGMLAPNVEDRISLTEVLKDLEDFPNRRRALGKMISLYFGRAGKRTGLSQVHFAASKELVDTFAVAKAAGVSLSKVSKRKRPGQPDDVPAGFEPVDVPRTMRVDPLEVVGALDDDLEQSAREAPGSLVDDDEEEKTTDWSPDEVPEFVASALQTQQRPASTLATAQDETDGPEQSDEGAQLAGVRKNVEEAAGQSRKTQDAVADLEDMAPRWSQPRDTLRSPDSEERSAPSTTTPSPPPMLGPPFRWKGSGDTLRASDGEQSPQRREPTMRLPADSEPSSPDREPDAPQGPTERLSPPRAGLGHALAVDRVPVVETSVCAESRDPCPPTDPEVGNQELEGSTPDIHAVTAVMAGSAGGAESGAQSKNRDVVSLPRQGRPPESRSRAAMFAVAVMVLSVGAGAWLTWTRTEARAQSEGNAVGDPSAAVSSLSEDSTTERDHETVIAAVAPVLGSGTTTGGLSDEDTESTHTGASALTEDAPTSTTGGLDTSNESSTGDASESTVPATDEVVEPPPLSTVAEVSSPARIKPPRPRAPAKPAPELDFVVRRGLAVGFAEIRVGRGKVHPVPSRGAATLRVGAGTYTLRYRAEPDGPWQKLRQTFSPGMKYTGQLELNGLRVMAVPDGKAG